MRDDTQPIPLRTARAERLLTVRGLEDLSGVSASGITRIERGQRCPTFRTMTRLAKALKLEVRMIQEFDEAIRRRATAGSTHFANRDGES